MTPELSWSGRARSRPTSASATTGLTYSFAMWLLSVNLPLFCAENSCGSMSESLIIKTWSSLYILLAFFQVSSIWAWASGTGAKCPGSWSAAICSTLPVFLAAVLPTPARLLRLVGLFKPPCFPVYAGIYEAGVAAAFAFGSALLLCICPFANEPAPLLYPFVGLLLLPTLVLDGACAVPTCMLLLAAGLLRPAKDLVPGPFCIYSFCIALLFLCLNIYDKIIQLDKKFDL